MLPPDQHSKEQSHLGSHEGQPSASRHQVFLSYSRKDLDVMMRVKSGLKEVGLTVWTDEGIEPGTTSWKRAIEDAILGAEVLIGILSPEAADSNWVRAELDFAELHGIRIFLLLARGDERSAVPFGFVTSQWIDLRPSFPAGFDLLKKAVQKHLAKEDTKPERVSIGQPVRTLDDVKTERVLRPVHMTVAATPDVSDHLPPPFAWVKLPSGPVSIEDASARGGTQGGLYLVPEFAVAKYPVTNAQYQVFVTAEDGYNDKGWWTFSESAKAWRENYPEPEPTAFPGDDLPRTDLSWYDAMAFSRWLMARVNKQEKDRQSIISLPTEEQWQRVAQGGDQREYPWGSTFDSALCNTEESNFKQTTPVTRYANGATRQGVMDMVGNLWEWCLNEWGGNEVNLEGDKARVVRGGSYASNQYHARCATRMQGLPFRRYFLRGMRLVSFQIVKPPNTQT